MGNFEINRRKKAQKRLMELTSELSANGLSNRSLVKKMYPDLDPEDFRFQNAYTTFNKKKNGTGNYVIDENYAKLICEAIKNHRKNPHIPYSTDIRWQWLAGYDDIKTYGEKKDAQARLVEYGENERLQLMEEAPYRMIEYAINMMGCELLDKTGPGSEAAPEYHLIIPREKDVILSRGTLESMENDLRTFASVLVSGELQRLTGEHKKKHPALMPSVISWVNSWVNLLKSWVNF